MSHSMSFQRPSSRASSTSSYAVDFDALPHSELSQLHNSYNKPDDDRTSSSIALPSPTAPIDVVRTDDIDGPVDFTQNLELYMRGDLPTAFEAPVEKPEPLKITTPGRWFDDDENQPIRSDMEDWISGDDGSPNRTPKPMRRLSMKSPPTTALSPGNPMSPYSPSKLLSERCLNRPASPAKSLPNASLKTKTAPILYTSFSSPVCRTPFPVKDENSIIITRPGRWFQNGELSNLRDGLEDWLDDENEPEKPIIKKVPGSNRGSATSSSAQQRSRSSTLSSIPETETESSLPSSRLHRTSSNTLSAYSEDNEPQTPRERRYQPTVEDAEDTPQSKLVPRARTPVDEVFNIQEILSKPKDEHDQWKSERITELESILTRMNKQLDSYRWGYKDLYKMFKRMCRNHDTELNDARQKNQEQYEQKLKEQRERHQQEMEEQQKKHKEEMEEQRKRYEVELRKQAEKLESQKKVMDEQEEYKNEDAIIIEELEDELQGLKERFEREKAAHASEDKNKEIKNLMSQCESLEKKVEQAENTATTATTTIENLKRTIETLETTNHDLEERNTKLTQELESMRSKAEAAVHKAGEIVEKEKTAREHAQKEVATLRTEIDALKSATTTLPPPEPATKRTTTSDDEMTAAEFRRTIDRLTGCLQQAMEAQRVADEQVCAHERRCAELKADGAVLHDDLDRLRRDRAAELDRWRQENGLLNGAMDRLVAREVRKRDRWWEGRVESLRREKEELAKALMREWGKAECGVAEVPGGKQRFRYRFVKRGEE